MNTRFRIYLGHEIAAYRGGGTVDVAKATDMVAQAFPAGFTVYNATGAWARDGQTIREASTVFEILGLAEQLRDTFRQDSVMVTTDTVSTVSV